MKKFSEDVKDLFVTTAECREEIANSQSWEAQQLVYSGLIEKVAESNAVMFNAGVEAGVKMMLLRNFEKLAAMGLGNPIDTLMIGLLVKMPLAKGAEKGESILNKAGLKFDGEPCKTDTGKPACCDPDTIQFPAATARQSHPNQRTQEDQLVSNYPVTQQGGGRPIIRRDTVCGEIRETIIEFVR